MTLQKGGPKRSEGGTAPALPPSWWTWLVTALLALGVGRVGFWKKGQHLMGTSGTTVVLTSSSQPLGGPGLPQSPASAKPGFESVFAQSPSLQHGLFRIVFSLLNICWRQKPFQDSAMNFLHLLQAGYSPSSNCRTWGFCNPSGKKGRRQETQHRDHVWDPTPSPADFRSPCPVSGFVFGLFSL